MKSVARELIPFTQSLPFLSQRWQQPPPVLIALIHGGMARLSRPE